MKQQRGFTLIEILVTVLIISTALLGLVGLQAAGVKNTVTSYNRTQASHLAYSMADRMRANVTEASKGTGSLYITLAPTSAAAKANCATLAGCSAVEMAENDLYEWNKVLADSHTGIPKTGMITATNCPTCSPYPLVFTIKITWGENRDDKADPSLTFQTDFQL